MTKIFPTDYDEKTTIAANDMILFSDSEDSDKLKKAKYSNLKGEKGDTGATGAKGDTGATGATGPQGPAGTNGTNGTNGTDGTSFTWKGAYSAGTTYAPNDAVSYNSQSYMCKLASTGNAPTNGTYRDLMAAKGADGEGSGDMLKATYDPANYNGQLEAVSNKKTTLADNSDTYYPTQKAVKTAVDAKQDTMTKATGAEVDTGTDDAKYVTAKAIADSKLSYTDGTETLTNKRINQRVVSAASYTTDTGTALTVANCDMFIVTAQAGALKFNNPGGTPTQGQKLIVRIKDNGTARALTYDTQFRAMGVALPSTTVLSKTLYLGFIYNDTDTKWDLIAVGQEA